MPGPISGIGNGEMWLVTILLKRPNDGTDGFKSNLEKLLEKYRLYQAAQQTPVDNSEPDVDGDVVTFSLWGTGGTGMSGGQIDDFNDRMEVFGRDEDPTRPPDTRGRQIEWPWFTFPPEEKNKIPDNVRGGMFQMILGSPKDPNWSTMARQAEWG